MDFVNELSHKWLKAQKELRKVIEKNWRNIVITFSGGKDSTALTLLTFLTLRQIRCQPSLWILYVDTQVDSPPLREAVDRSFEVFNILAKRENINVRTQVLAPDIHHNFWVLLIGKGYPPPSFYFRWCTDKLKIKPIRNFLKDLYQSEGFYPLVLTGIRLKESSNRIKNIVKKIKDERWIKFIKDCWMYAPLLEFESSEIWDFISWNEDFWKVSFDYLRDLYLFSSNGLSTFRTGCWVCTLVRHDKSLEKLSDRYPHLKQMVSFRHYLLRIKDRKELRMWVSRSGKKYRGPLKLSVRKEILDKLETFLNLPEEIKMEIFRLWEEQEHRTVT